MTAPYPTDWQVYPESDFATFGREGFADVGKGLLVLVRLGPDHKPRDFRLCLVGKGDFACRIPLTIVFPNLPAHLRNQYLDISCAKEYAEPYLNSVVSVWRCVEEYVKARMILTTDKDGNQFDPQPLITYLTTADSDGNFPGASLRWAIGVDHQQRPRLEVQGLPSAAKYLNKQTLKGENAVTTLLAEFPLNSDMFDGETASGPVPLFFSKEREAALAYLLDHPGKALGDIMAVNSRLLRMEYMSLPEAVAYLAQNRHRQGKGVAAYQSTSLPSQKRLRQDTSITDPGNNFDNIAG